MIEAIIIISLALVLVFLLYVLSTMGRTKHPKLRLLHGYDYAHRGLHGNGVPENSREAFRLAKEAGYGVELDVHLLRDGNLAVFHDSTLIRMTGAEGRVEDLTVDQLDSFHLDNTDETIPEFGEVLKLFDGKVPLVVELKEAGNCAALCEKTCKMLEDYQAPYCIESFDPRCIRWLRKHRPDIIRGQLTKNYFKSKDVKLPWILKFLLVNQILNFVTLPDFVAYKFNDRKTLSNTLSRKFWGVQGVSWTIRSKDDYNTAVKEGWLAIFEGFRP